MRGPCGDLLTAWAVLVRIMQQNASEKLPLYMLPGEVEALISCADDPKAELTMRLQWRAGMRVSEAVNLTPDSVDHEDNCFRLIGKFGFERLIPVHPELITPIRMMSYRVPGHVAIVGVHRSTAWRWVQLAWAKAVERGLIDSRGRQIGTHTLRHSAARHWLDSGIPINRVSLWLGHRNIATTWRYLRLLPDPGDTMQDIP